MGSPTGQSDCGFKEEFDLAESRWDKSQKPHIFLYVKNIDESKLAQEEIGTYSKVKQFKEEIKDKAWLTGFDSADDLKAKVRKRVNRFIHDTKSNLPSQISSDLYRKLSQENPPKKRGESNPLSKEMRRLGSDISKLIMSNKSLDKLADFQKIRLFLASSAVLYGSRLFEVLGNNENHLFYFHKENIGLSGSEKMLIFRTILSDQFNGKSGWF